MTSTLPVLDLTLDMRVSPVEGVQPRTRDWLRAAKLLNHSRRCKCSTCLLAATLGRAIRDQEGKP